jgi:Undecaprenyl-phosphate glucose phosphotransferase
MEVLWPTNRALKPFRRCRCARTKFAVSLMAHTELTLPRNLDALSRRSRSVGTRHLPNIAPCYAAIAAAVFASDLVSIVAASVGTGVAYQWLFYGRVGRVQEFLSLALLVAALVLPVLHLRGHYRAKELPAGRASLLALASTWTGVFLFLAVLAFGLKVGSVFSRGWIHLFFISGICLLIGERLLWQTRLARAVTNGTMRLKKVALIGNPAAIYRGTIEEDLSRVGVTITKKIPLLAPASVEQIADQSSIQQPIHTDLRPVLRSLRGSDLDEILIAGGWTDWLYIRRNLNALSAAPFPVRLLLDTSLADLVARPMSHLGTLSALELQRAPLSAVELTLKRLLDIVLSSFAIVLLSPVIALAALAIRLESHGPVLFRQTRNGFNGRPFQIYKFRSMQVLEDGPSIRQATRSDPRVTTVGRFLRRTSIDELPQFLNVLSGEMSVIGPRPHAVAHDEHYDDRVARYAYRQHVKPGITGWAQVNGCRGETFLVEAMEERVHLDLWYISNWSLWLDVKIVMLTFVSLVTDRNVY